MNRPARGAYRMNRAALQGVSVVPPGVGMVPSGAGVALSRLGHFPWLGGRLNFAGV